MSRIAEVFVVRQQFRQQEIIAQPQRSGGELRANFRRGVLRGHRNEFGLDRRVCDGAAFVDETHRPHAHPRVRRFEREQREIFVEAADAVQRPQSAHTDFLRRAVEREVLERRDSFGGFAFGEDATRLADFPVVAVFLQRNQIGDRAAGEIECAGPLGVFVLHLI